MRGIVKFVVFAFILTACGDGRLSPQGGTITGATVNGGLVVTSAKLGLIKTCAEGEVLKWDDVAEEWECGTGGVSDGDKGDITVSSSGAVWTVDSSAVAYSELSGAFSTSNVIPKGDGSGLVASSWTDDGTTSTTTGNVTVTGSLRTDTEIQLRAAANNYLYTSLAGSAGNQNLVMTAAGAGGIYLQTNIGGLNNSGTGGVIIGPGGAASTTMHSFAANGDATHVGSLTSGDGAGDVFDHNGDLAKFGATGDGRVYINDNTLNWGYATDSDTTGFLNYYGYNLGTTRFRNLVVADGKNAAIATFTGSDKSLAVVGLVDAQGGLKARNAASYGLTAMYLGATASDQPKIGWRASDDSERFRVEMQGINGASERLAFIKTIGGEAEVLSVEADGEVKTYGNTTAGDAAADTFTATGYSRVYSMLSGADNVDAFTVGNLTTSTTSADVGWGVGLDRSGGSIFFDHKLGASGAIYGRVGSGTSPGWTNLWLGVNGSGNATLYGSTQLGDNAADIVDIYGRLTQSDAPVASTGTRFVHNVTAGGTYDTTAGGLIAIATLGNATATRSAGANNLTNVGLYGTASGGQVNYGLWVDSGDVQIDAVLGVDGNAFLNANTQLGDASSDRVGIGTAPDSNEAMRFAAAAGSKITLYPSTSASNYGFGIQAGQLQYYVTDTSGIHSFGYGDSDAFTETHRLSANGDTQLGFDSGDRVGIGIAPNADSAVTFANAVGNKLLFYSEGANTYYGLGIEGTIGSLQYFVPGTGMYHAFGYGDSDAFTEAARIEADGDVHLNMNGGATLVDGNLTSGNGAGDVFDHNGSIAKFGNTSDGAAYFNENQLNFGYSTSANNYTGSINYAGYAASNTYDRNLNIYNGKNTLIASFTGSTLAAAFNGPTTFGDADSDTANSRATFGVSGTDVTINACGTSPAISGEAQSFQLTVGSGTTTCVVNFNRTFASAPYCTFSAVNDQAALDMASDGGNGDGPRISATTTTVTMTFDANTESSPIYNVWCPARY